MSDIEDWSTTAASNNSASPDGFPEGMAPSGVNNSAREVMASVKTWWGTIGRNYINGLTLSNDTDTDHDILIAVGAARDTTNAYDMALTTAITKQIDASWAVGDDAGGLDGTESSAGTPDANTNYYVWLIKRSDTGVVDALFSESATSPTMPSNYDAKRLIGMVHTDSSANIIGFTQVGDYFRYTGDIITDVNDNTITSNTAEVGTLSVPPNSLAHIYGYLENTATTATEGSLMIRTNGAADDITTNDESFLKYNGGGVTFDWLSGIGTVLVDSSSQVQYAATETDGTATVEIRTIGFWMLTRSNPL